jgi:hypothetical protein
MPKVIEVNMPSWGFKVGNVNYSGVRLWYGSEDMHTTPTMGKYMADRLPASVCKKYSGHSYLMIWIKEDSTIC